MKLEKLKWIGTGCSLSTLPLLLFLLFYWLAGVPERYLTTPPPRQQFGHSEAFRQTCRELEKRFVEEQIRQIESNPTCPGNHYCRELLASLKEESAHPPKYGHMICDY